MQGNLSKKKSFEYLNNDFSLVFVTMASKACKSVDRGNLMMVEKSLLEEPLFAGVELLVEQL